jgi:hypothetical protein
VQEDPRVTGSRQMVGADVGDLHGVRR